jgi:hypothetical protein
VSAVTVTRRDLTLHVSAPYDPAFVAGAKKLGGRWNPEQRVWTVPLPARAQLRELMICTYGTAAGLPDEPPLAPRPLLPTPAEVERVIAEYTLPAGGADA